MTLFLAFGLTPSPHASKSRFRAGPRVPRISAIQKSVWVDQGGSILGRHTDTRTRNWADFAEWRGNNSFFGFRADCFSPRRKSRFRADPRVPRISAIQKSVWVDQGGSILGRHTDTRTRNWADFAEWRGTTLFLAFGLTPSPHASKSRFRADPRVPRISAIQKSVWVDQGGSILGRHTDTRTRISRNGADRGTRESVRGKRVGTDDEKPSVLGDQRLQNVSRVYDGSGCFVSAQARWLNSPTSAVSPTRSCELERQLLNPIGVWNP